MTKETMPNPAIMTLIAGTLILITYIIAIAGYNWYQNAVHINPTESSTEITAEVETYTMHDDDITITTTDGRTITFLKRNVPHDPSFNPLAAGAIITYKQHPEDDPNYNMMTSITTPSSDNIVNGKE